MQEERATLTRFDTELRELDEVHHENGPLIIWLIY